MGQPQSHPHSQSTYEGVAGSSGVRHMPHGHTGDIGQAVRLNHNGAMSAQGDDNVLHTFVPQLCGDVSQITFQRALCVRSKR